MSRILGLDLGTNSIGWAIVDDETNRLLNFGVKIFKNLPKSKTIIASKKKKRYSNATITLNAITFISLMLCVVNTENWQFWLNITLTATLTKITLSNQVNR